MNLCAFLEVKRALNSILIRIQRVLNRTSTPSSLGPILKKWALVVPTPSCRHSAVSFTVRNIDRCPLNFMCYFACFFWGGYKSFCCKTNVARAVCQMACDWKGLAVGQRNLAWVFVVLEPTWSHTFSYHFYMQVPGTHTHRYCALCIEQRPCCQERWCANIENVHV